MPRFGRFLRDRLELRFRHQRAGRVARRVDDDAARARRDRVRGTSRPCSANPSSACVCTMTGVASASLICSTSVGQPGMCVMTSSPSPNSTIDRVEQRLLAAGGDDRLRWSRSRRRCPSCSARTIARFSSSVPELVVYLVKLASIAALAAAADVLRASESPAPPRRDRRRRCPSPSAPSPRRRLSSSATTAIRVGTRS